MLAGMRFSGTNGERSHLRALSPTQSLPLRQATIVLSQTANKMIPIRLAASTMMRSATRSVFLMNQANLSSASPWAFNPTLRYVC